MNLLDTSIDPRRKLAVLANENPLPKAFDCTKCHAACGAECCTAVPLPPRLIERNYKRIQRKVVKLIPIADAVIPITESGKCCFLTNDLQCAIYKWRPPICRLFGTEIHKDLTCHFMDKQGNVRNSHTN
jgi:Fe-S-cluster containining protein